jgi:sugar phosphate isomerase/epimerase
MHVETRKKEVGLSSPLRFGIGSMQVGRMMELAGSTEGLLEYILTFDHAAAVRDLAEHGFGIIELSGDVELFLPGAYSEAAVEGLAALKQELGLAYTVHLPMWSVEPSSPQQDVRRGSVEAVVRSIKTVAPLEPEVYVLHATNALAAEFGRWRLPPVAKTALMGILQANAQKSLEEILDATGVAGRLLAIETIEFPFDLTLELAEELDLGVCVDVGHVLAGFSGQIDPFEALERVGPRLAEIHLHDSPRMGPGGEMRYDLDHRPLGAGDLDVPRLLRTLEAAGFTGPIVFELALDQAVASMGHIRELVAV